MPRADPTGPHVVNVDSVELVEVGAELVTVEGGQLAELVDSPTALEYRARIAKNVSKSLPADHWA